MRNEKAEMMVLSVVRNCWKFLRKFIAYPVLLSRLEKRYPTCHLHTGISIDEDSLLGNYNVIFQNVTITNSVIGNHTFIQKDSIINHANIGKFCSIAMRVTIGTGQHPTDHLSSHPAFYSFTQPLAKTYCKKDTYEPFRQTIIGHDVWIGQNALVNDGLNIGIGAVIAAGAVVTKDIPEYAIVAGVPAKIIKYRFDEDLRQKIILTKWWDKPESWLQKNYSLFSNPHKLINNYK